VRPNPCQSSAPTVPAAPTAAISIDLDSATTHLVGYRRIHHGADRLLDVAVGRVLELLSARGLRATFFVVSRDVEPAPDWLRAISQAGHEIASHSVTHAFGLSRLPRPRLQQELTGSREALEQVTGVGVTGFRAPNWDITPRVIQALARAGYAWDASLLPTPLLVPARLLLALKARSASGLVAMAPWPMSLRRGVTRHATDHGVVVEVPVSVTRWRRWPIYHTLRYGMSPPQFAGLLEGIARERELLSYPFHAIDAVGIEEDGIDPQLRRHPGGAYPRAAKLALLEETLGAIGDRFVCRTLGEVAEAAGKMER
jgi:peptidoglycan-N-acetylglucosamine deacetylase